jgi:hypothetical protein
VATLPTTDIDLGDQSEETSGFIRILGLDGAGVVRARGESLPVDLGALAGTSIDVFMQRTGELSELPSPLPDSRPAPLLDFVGSEFVLVLGGGDASLATGSELYDLVTYSPVSQPPTMPFVPLSIAVNGTQALLIDGGATATWYDFSDGTTTTVGTASGETTFADVAGGLTFYDDSGTAYIVGATRTTGAPTASVLVVDGSTAELSLDTLSDPRLGAAAAYVIGRGLVVAGGSASAAGVEVIAAGTTTGSAQGYAPDATTGAGASALDASHVLLAGGVTASGGAAATRVLDLTCGQGCSPTLWGSPPETLVTAQAFAIDAATAFVVGNDGAGSTHTMTLSAGGATELPLRNARTNARGVYLPTGAIGVVGGGSDVIEAFTP